MGWFSCKNRKTPWCVSPFWRCDNQQHCTDGSDEDNCPTLPPPETSRPAECSYYQCTPLQVKILDHHNKLRAAEVAGNMNELNWSKADEQNAKAQADLCRLSRWGEPPHGNLGPDGGQNVAWRSYPVHIRDEDVVEMITWWYGEKLHYNFDQNSCAEEETWPLHNYGECIRETCWLFSQELYTWKTWRKNHILEFCL